MPELHILLLNINQINIHKQSLQRNFFYAILNAEQAVDRSFRNFLHRVGSCLNGDTIKSSMFLDRVSVKDPLQSQPFNKWPYKQNPINTPGRR